MLMWLAGIQDEEPHPRSRDWVVRLANANVSCTNLMSACTWLHAYRHACNAISDVNTRMPLQNQLIDHLEMHGLARQDLEFATWSGLLGTFSCAVAAV